jgi:hypothetical protein
MLPPFHGERMRAYGSVMAERPSARPRGPWGGGFRSGEHAGDHAGGDPAGGVRVEDERRQLLRRNLVGILATTRSPRAIDDDRPPAPRRPTGGSGRCCRGRRDPSGGDSERRGDPHRVPQDILSLLLASRDEQGVAMTEDELRD